MVPFSTEPENARFIFSLDNGVFINVVFAENFCIGTYRRRQLTIFGSPGKERASRSTVVRYGPTDLEK